MKKLILEGTGSTVNNVIKALLIGLLVGAISGLVGVDYDFDTEWGRYDYNTPVAIIVGLTVSGLLFIRYNKKEA
jgi:hypothetical protein